MKPQIKIGWLAWLIARKAKLGKPAKISTNIYLIRGYSTATGWIALVRLSDGYVFNAPHKNLAKTIDPHDPSFDPAVLPEKAQSILVAHLERDAEKAKRREFYL